MILTKIHLIIRLFPVQYSLTVHRHGLKYQSFYVSWITSVFCSWWDWRSYLCQTPNFELYTGHKSYPQMPNLNFYFQPQMPTISDLMAQLSFLSHTVFQIPICQNLIYNFEVSILKLINFSMLPNIDVFLKKNDYILHFYHQDFSGMPNVFFPVYLVHVQFIVTTFPWDTQEVAQTNINNYQLWLWIFNYTI